MMQNLNTVLQQWSEAKKTLDAAKAAEMRLRLIIVNESGLFDPAKASGTQTVAIGNGWSVKAEKKIDYKVDNKQGEAFAVMHQLCAMGESTARIAKDLFSFDANIRTTKYKELTDEERKVVDTILTNKPATPSLTLIEPKE